MCLNRIKVFNEHCGQHLYVDCGVCFSCLNKKSNSTCSKIMNDYESGFNYYFVTFTYDNGHVPYVLFDDLYVGSYAVNVYRGASLLESVVLDDTLTSSEISSIPSRAFLRKFPFKNCFGVVYFKDIQDFFKRLRKYAKNSFTFSYFALAELGETFFRPHFHVLFKTHADFDTFRKACITCWPLCDWLSVPRAFEKAFNPAQYLSQYLTLRTSLPLFYQIPAFSQRQSHSLHFGQSVNELRLPFVFDNAEQHNLTYYKKTVSSSGIAVYSPFPLPKYIIYRYFPVFKGFSKLSYSEFLFFCKSFVGYDPRNCVFEKCTLSTRKLNKGIIYDGFFFSFQFPANILKYALDYDIPISSINRELAYNYRLFMLIKRMNLCHADFSVVINTLNRIRNYARLLNVSFEYYLMILYNIRVSLFSSSFKNSHKNMSLMDYKHFYFNFSDFLNLKVRAPTLEPLLELSSLDEFSDISALDVQDFHDSQVKLTKFNKNNKQKKHLL